MGLAELNRPENAWLPVRVSGTVFSVTPDEFDDDFVVAMLCDGEAIRAKAEGRTVYDAINQMLKESPVGSRRLIYLPYLLGERSPRWNPIARGAYIGLTMEHTRSDLVHAALEGVLMNLSIILECFRKQQSIDSLRLIGGLAQSDEICRMLANIFGVQAVLMDKLEEATSMGAAVCGGVGTLFALALGFVTGLREQHGWLLYLYRTA